MCGITGFIDFTHAGHDRVLRAMTDALAHRGPDDEGYWLGTIRAAQVGLGHRRLSIIDLRPEAAQPMTFERLTVVFNGEIYNHVEIRHELERLGHVFRTRSDTEVLLHAFDEWGPECVQRFVGMFAFVLVDRGGGKAFLVRDRAGVKPLYVHRAKDAFLFASETKAFHPHPSFSPRLDAAGLSQYFDFGYLPGTQSVFEDTEKVEAGSWLEIDLDTGQRSTHRYWSIDAHYRQEKLSISYAEALERFGQVFQSACQYRMVADVPVGVFLSGGYDSTAVLASLVHTNPTPIKAFTIGFETGNNEVPQASAIAAVLGCEHRTYVCTEDDARKIIPQLPDIYDEPFADSSAIPTVLVSRFAKEHVKVALSADGGDELLFGYKSYAQLGRRMARLSRLPRGSRRTIAAAMRAAAALVPSAFVHRKHMLEGLARALHADDRQMAVQLHVIVRQLPDAFRRSLFSGFEAASVEHPLFAVEDQGLLNEAAAWDFGHYLAGDVLVKVDRATMSVSLEGREPFLDHRLAEFAARLPSAYKFDGKSQKRILRDYVHRYVPKDVMVGPKRGFSVPVLQWLREDLSHLVDEHLSTARLADSGFLRPDKVAPLVRSFRKGQLPHENLIWKLLMFQMWHDRWIRS